MEKITYEENILLRAIELAKTRLKHTWEILPEEIKEQEIQWSIPEAKKAMEWAAETAHAVNGPQMSKTIINAMLEELGVIPKSKTEKPCAGGE